MVIYVMDFIVVVNLVAAWRARNREVGELRHFLVIGNIWLAGAAIASLLPH